MKKKLHYRNGRWCVAAELDNPVQPAYYDDSLIALARWMICEIKALWTSRRL